MLYEHFLEDIYSDNNQSIGYVASFHFLAFRFLGQSKQKKFNFPTPFEFIWVLFFFMIVRNSPKQL